MEMKFRPLNKRTTPSLSLETMANFLDKKRNCIFALLNVPHFIYIYFPTEPHSMQGSNYIVCTVIDFFRTTHLPFIIICCLFVWIAITDVAIYRNGGSWKIRDLVRRKSTKTRRVTKKLDIFLSTFVCPSLEEKALVVEHMIFSGLNLDTVNG